MTDQQKHYTDEDVRQAMHALTNYEPTESAGFTAETKGAATFVLDVVAPAIATRGEVLGLSEAALILRDCAAQGLGLAAAERAIARRADEIEAAS